MARFVRWCNNNSCQSLPAEPGVVAAYLSEAAAQPGLAASRPQWRYTPNTLGRWVAGINKVHSFAGLPMPGSAPGVKAVLAGVRRSRATPPVRKAPLLINDIERVVTAIPIRTWPAGPGGLRDRALLIMGWAGAFRRSELAELRIGDITVHPEDGLHVRLRHSKTDQEAAGTVRALPYARKRPALCAPCAFVDWLRLVCGWDGTDGGPGGRAGAMRALRAIAASEQSKRGGHSCSTNLPELAAEAAAAPLPAAFGDGRRGSLETTAARSVRRAPQHKVNESECVAVDRQPFNEMGDGRSVRLGPLPAACALQGPGGQRSGS